MLRRFLSQWFAPAPDPLADAVSKLADAVAARGAADARIMLALHAKLDAVLARQGKPVPVPARDEDDGREPWVVPFPMHLVGRGK
jgi:hypothetical protein